MLDAVRPLVRYDAVGRSKGWLLTRDTPWLASFASTGADLLRRLHRQTDVWFTLVLFQAYADGAAHTDWHTDTTSDAQAILSLGATRTLGTRHNGQRRDLKLAAGDLVVMPSGFQREWEHAVLPDPDVVDERVSLVFCS